MKSWGPVIAALLYLLLLTTAACSEIRSSILPGAYAMNEYLPRIASKKLGLIINQGSLINDVNLVDTLLNLEDSTGKAAQVLKIFTPEHGFEGRAGAGESVNDTIYSNHAIPVVSLYGIKKKPEAIDLKGIEVMILDLQDVGVRFFTYLSTLHFIMEVCAENDIPLIVLDRPNPNGFYIDGPMLDLKYKSFVGLDPVPLVYGMTIGEYAQMINGEYWLTDSLQCDLIVIKCRNYSHAAFYNLPVPPSPNLQDMQSVYLYPSTCLFEGTVVTEGRGTDSPFRIVGHPGFSNHTFSFIPRSIPGLSLNPKFKGTVCYGLDLRQLSVDSLKSTGRIDLRYLKTFYDDLRMGEAFFTDYFNLLAGNSQLRSQIISGMSVDEIRKSWLIDLEAFKKIRAKYLLYPDFD
jgi:uncharacterized protein YbbC (DUF1343 family)